MPVIMRLIELVFSVSAWIGIGLLILFLGRIAYFYEKTSGQRVRYYLVLIPGLLLTLGAFWYFAHSIDFTGEPVGDLLFFFGGLSLMLFGFHLQDLMTGERK